ncbi:MAG: class I tRNA ligase family protein [Candidatus Azambacteria bacterium]|nr:class I tRNA ligase family protein [Candidatus Azambacteria bacterium]
MKLDSPYNPQEVENKIYKLWEKSGFFNPDKLPPPSSGQAVKRKKKFSVMMAPPNITGSLHLGHALENISIDILIRMKRMQGFKTLWLPGIDHAGIAAQNVVEKELRKQGINRQDLGREKFIKKVKEWKEKYGIIILDQLKKLGALPDWSRIRYTLDSEYTKAVLKAFAHYYKKGWIYRGERVINWCVRCATSISDLEVNYVPEKAKLYFIKYGPLTLATTRPETKLGDTALAVYPNDSRYKKYVGENLEILSVDNKVPINQPAKVKKIKVSVVADQAVDPEFGTGIIKVTPAHDITDFEIAERHNLPIITIIDEHGRMNENAGLRYKGMKVTEAREQIIKDLEALGLVEKIEDYEHNIARCDRCNSVIEPRPSKQWFLKMKELAKLAIAAIKSKETVIYPKKWEKVLLDRLKNERDWNISRQLWWGHKIPIEGETDVLDTWFSSALWPFATLGWPENTKDLKTFYPTDYITSAREILNIWIAKMIFSGKELTGKTPFKTVHIHATILTKEGKRMSKSLGTGIDPLDLVERFGADATRFGIIWQATGNQDIRWSEEHVVAGKKFCNKIWNATRFIVMSTENAVTSKTALNLTPADKKILVGLKKVKKETSRLIEIYDFSRALHLLYGFFWHEYADIYIETAKKQLADEKSKSQTKIILFTVHEDLIKLLHPFLPFLTEEIWGILKKSNKPLMIEEWPH